MKASLLYSGENYAYHSNPPKGRIPVNAIKVRLRHTEQRKSSFQQNRSTYAAITIVDGDQAGRELTVPARKLIDFWESYQHEQKHLLREKLEREKKYRRDQLRREISEAHANYALTTRGLPFTVSTFGENFIVNRAQMLSWLGITESAVSESIEQVIEREYAEKEAELNA